MIKLNPWRTALCRERFENVGGGMSGGTDVSYSLMFTGCQRAATRPKAGRSSACLSSIVRSYMTSIHALVDVILTTGGGEA